MRKLGAILLVVLLMCTHVGLAYSIHYCGGKAVDARLSIGQSDLGCGMEAELECYKPAQGDIEIYQTPCCDDKQQYIGVSKIVKTGQNAIELPKLDSKALSEIHSVSFTEKHIQHAFIQFTDLPPPNRQIDRQVLFQTFII